VPVCDLGVSAAGVCAVEPTDTPQTTERTLSLLKHVAAESNTCGRGL